MATAKLLDRGASVEARTHDGFTPIDRAAKAVAALLDPRFQSLMRDAQAALYNASAITAVARETNSGCSRTSAQDLLSFD